MIFSPRYCHYIDTVTDIKTRHHQNEAPSQRGILKITMVDFLMDCWKKEWLLFGKKYIEATHGKHNRKCKWEFLIISGFKRIWT